MSNRIGAVILAAGTASRMGKQKLLLSLNGRPLLTHVLDTVHKVPWSDCIAVIGEPAADLAGLCQQRGIRSVYNSQRLEGQATSLTLALRHLSGDLAGIMFFLGDQPLISLALIESLIAQFFQAGSPKAIIVPCQQGQRYSPVLFGSYWRSDLAALTGDIGGRQIIRANPAQVIEVRWPEPECFYDADTEAEYLQLKNFIENKRG